MKEFAVVGSSLTCSMELGLVKKLDGQDLSMNSMEDGAVCRLEQ